MESNTSENRDPNPIAAITGILQESQESAQGPGDETKKKPIPKAAGVDANEPITNNDNDSNDLQGSKTDQNEQEQTVKLSEESAPGTDENQEPVTPNFSALAEQLGVEVKDLYATEVPLAFGLEPMTIGQMKDQFQDLKTVQGKQDKYETERVTFENDMMRTRQVMAAMFDKIPPEIAQAARAEAESDYRDTLSRERSALIESIPEFSDPVKYQTSIKGMTGLVKEYGFSAHELGNVIDHRLVKMIKDYSELKNRVTTAETAGKRVINSPRKPAGKVSKPNAKAARDDLVNRAKAGDRSAQVSAISQLLSR